MKTFIFIFCFWIGMQLVSSALLTTDLLEELKDNPNYCKELKNKKLTNKEEQETFFLMHVSPYVIPVKYMVAVDLAFKVATNCKLKDLSIPPKQEGSIEK